MKKLNKKGFTLIELIVVIAILAILALILIPSITGYITSATKAKDEANARAAYSSAVLIASTWDEVDADGKTTITEALVATAVEAQIAGLPVGKLTVHLDATTNAVTSIDYKPASETFTYPK